MTSSNRYIFQIIIFSTILSIGNLSAQISQDNLLAYYSFDGDVLDRSQNGYDGSLVGGSFTSDAFGNPNSALRFDGINDYINLTAFAEEFKNNMEELTIYFLVKFESDKTSQTIISLGNAGEDISNNVFEVEYEHFHFQVETETGTNTFNNELEIDQTQFIIDGKWHQILIKIKGDSLTYCRDNQLIYKGTYVPVETTTNEMFIGSFAGNNNAKKCCFFNGIIDELQFYKSITLVAEDTIYHTGCQSDNYSIDVNSTIYDESNPSGVEIITSNCCLDSIITIDLVYHDDYYEELFEQYCENSNYEIEVNNVIYNIDNPVGIEYMETLNQCDSIINIALEYIPTFYDTINYAGCKSDEYSIEVNQQIYDVDNPEGLEIMQSSNGCDSIISIKLDFYDDFYFEIFEQHCEGSDYQLEINNVIYNIDNPKGIEFLIAENQCDSVINIDLLFVEIIEINISNTYCENDGSEIDINGYIYNQNNPIGVETIAGIFGCDTIFYIDLEYLPITYDTFLYLGCIADSFNIEINENTYNIENPNGLEVLQNVNGCDSIITVHLEFHDDYYQGFFEQHCANSNYQIEINNVVYDVDNPKGTEILKTINQCDSIIEIDLIFTENINVEMSSIVCANEGFEIEVNGNIYNQDNPIGIEMIKGEIGCDTILNINLQFLPIHSDTILLDDCDDDTYSIEINSIVYDQTNPSGVEVIQSTNGCDSIIVIDLDFPEIGCGVYFANVINPNSHNSEFYPIFNPECGIEITKLLIYDRWGNLLFNTVTIPWDGYFNNKLVTQGVYTYRCEITSQCLSYNKMGTITVLY